MGQGSRPERVADQIRAEVSSMIARDLQDPGIGFMTITRVEVSPDLQHARVYYTTLGDPAARTNTGKALERASSFMKRQIGQRLRLRRAPQLEFVFDRNMAVWSSIKKPSPGAFFESLQPTVADGHTWRVEKQAGDEISGEVRAGRPARTPETDVAHAVGPRGETPRARSSRRRAR